MTDSSAIKKMIRICLSEKILNEVCQSAFPCSHYNQGYVNKRHNTSISANYIT